MNQRIKELASQCWDLRLDGRHFDQEQFAELIVKECSRIALSDEVAHMNPQSTAENISKEILKIIE